MNERRIWSVMVLFVLVASAFVLKSARLQTHLHTSLEGWSEAQSKRVHTLRGRRGAIRDRAGHIMAMDVEGWSVSLRPQLVRWSKEEFLSVAQILAMKPEELATKVNSDSRFTWLRRRATESEVHQLRELKVNGIDFHPLHQRFYPHGDVAGALLGTVNIDGVGQSGLEAKWEETLRGHDLKLPMRRDNRGRLGYLAGGFAYDVRDGEDVHTTLDLNLQSHLDILVQEAGARLNPKSISVVVLDVEEGELRGLASYPSFDPNRREGNPRIHALSDMFEPGSTMKTVAFASLIEHGLFRAGKKIDCEQGKLSLGDFTIRDTHRYDVLTSEDVYKKSSNIGTLKLALELSETQTQSMLRDFGFGESTGLGMREEARGRLPKRKKWGKVRRATISYGHGLMATPLQLASMGLTIASGGLRRKLKLISNSAPHEESEHALTGDISEPRRVLSKKSALRLTRLMERVTEKGGTGGGARIPGIRVAGKTGTAEKVDPESGQYSRSHHMASFVGFAPAEQPRLVAYVVVDEPQGIQFGGSVAGPLWADAVEYGLRYAIDNNRKIVRSMDDARSLLALEEEKKAIPRAGAPLRNGNGVLVGSETLDETFESASNTTKETYACLPLYIEKNPQNILPGSDLSANAESVDFCGLDPRSALTRASQLGVELRFEGVGNVVGQKNVQGKIHLKLSDAWVDAWPSLHNEGR